jgi:hypothetical protein
MSAKKFFVVSAVVIIGVAAGVAWRNVRLARATESALTSLASQQTGMDTEMRRLEGQLAAAEMDRLALQSKLDALRKSRTRVAAAPVPPARATSEHRSTIAERLQKEPDTQRFYLAALKAEAAAKYGALFRALALSPTEIGKFQDILIKRDEQNMDLTAIKQSQGLSDQDATVMKLQKENEAEYQAAQQALLGETRYRQLQDYERTTYVREMVNGWAGGAVVEGRLPFTAPQAEQLIQVLANASSSYRNGGAVKPFEIDWDAADAQARSILSEAQFELFKTMEPPLPVGARFQNQLYGAVARATKAEAASKAAPTLNGPGG